MKNPWVIYEVNDFDEEYSISYTFKDHLGNTQNFKLIMPKETTDRAIDKFGIPNWLFDPYEDNEYNRNIRQSEMAKGLFKLHGDVIEMDKSKAVDYYSESYGKPIAEMIQRSLVSMNRDTRLDRIEMAIRFVQDIPYGTPLYNDKVRHYGGVNVPPKLLIEGFGDCDSKALLFVSILVYLIPADDIIFLNQKDHLLTAIKGPPEKGLTYVQFKGEKYLIAETAGPGKRKLGEKGSYYQSKFLIEPLQITQPEIIDFEVSDESLAKTNSNIASENIAGNTLILLNDNNQYFRFQMSTNGKTWEKLQLKPNQTGKYVFDMPTMLTLRYKTDNYSFENLEIATGHQYNIVFNSMKNKWELRE